MSGKVTQFMKTQKYRFDFGTDGKLYVVIFNGKIPQAELKGLLSSLHNCLYGKIPDIIPLYLKQRHLEYSNFNSIEIPLENYNAMEWAAYLIHSDTYGKVDETLGDADVYFSIMDYQEILPKGDCEGCYFAVGRLSSGCHGYKYNAIAQTFSSHSHGLGEQGCFAIRESGCDGNLRDVVKESGEPALPTFGCVDMVALLPNLENFKTKEEVLRAAIK